MTASARFMMVMGRCVRHKRSKVCEGLLLQEKLVYNKKYTCVIIKNMESNPSKRHQTLEKSPCMVAFEKAWYFDRELDGEAVPMQFCDLEHIQACVEENVETVVMVEADPVVSGGQPKTATGIEGTLCAHSNLYFHMISSEENGFNYPTRTEKDCIEGEAKFRYFPFWTTPLSRRFLSYRLDATYANNAKETLCMLEEKAKGFTFNPKRSFTPVFVTAPDLRQENSGMPSTLSWTDGGDIANAAFLSWQIRMAIEHALEVFKASKAPRRRLVFTPLGTGLREHHPAYVATIYRHVLRDYQQKLQTAQVELVMLGASYEFQRAYTTPNLKEVYNNFYRTYALECWGTFLAHHGDKVFLDETKKKREEKYKLDKSLNEWQKKNQSKEEKARREVLARYKEAKTWVENVHKKNNTSYREPLAQKPLLRYRLLERLELKDIEREHPMKPAMLAFRSQMSAEEIAIVQPSWVQKSKEYALELVGSGLAWTLAFLTVFATLGVSLWATPCYGLLLTWAIGLKVDCISPFLLASGGICPYLFALTCALWLSGGGLSASISVSFYIVLSLMVFTTDAEQVPGFYPRFPFVWGYAYTAATLRSEAVFLVATLALLACCLQGAVPGVALIPLALGYSAWLVYASLYNDLTYSLSLLSLALIGTGGLILHSSVMLYTPALWALVTPMALAISIILVWVAPEQLEFYPDYSFPGLRDPIPSDRRTLKFETAVSQRQVGMQAYLASKKSEPTSSQAVPSGDLCRDAHHDLLEPLLVRGVPDQNLEKPDDYGAGEGVDWSKH